MTEVPLNPGEEIDVVVTAVAPFGVLVRTDAGLHGLVRGVNDPVGVAIHVRVLDVDAKRQTVQRRGGLTSTGRPV